MFSSYSITLIHYKLQFIDVREEWIWFWWGCSCCWWLCEGALLHSYSMLYSYNYVNATICWVIKLNFMFLQHVLRELPSSPVPASCCTALLEAYSKSDLLVGFLYIFLFILHVIFLCPWFETHNIINRIITKLQECSVFYVILCFFAFYAPLAGFM